MPSFHITPDECSIFTHTDIGEGSSNCDRPPTVTAVWRFEPVATRILLCDVHAAELSGHERLTRRGPA